MQVMAHQGDTVDSLCWRFYGKTQGLCELVLEANQGLAAHGAVLPLGLVVEMPNQPAQSTSQQTIQLWD